MKKLNTLVCGMLIATSVNAVVITSNDVNKTQSTTGGSAINFSLTGDSNDSFTFEIFMAGPYPNWQVALTTGGDGGLNASQIAMANGYHALLGAEADVAAQGTWTGGNLYAGSSFFSLFGTDPNGWKGSTGYVGLRFKHFVDGIGVVNNYGWAEFAFVETPDPEVRSITLTRYAYETDYNTTITTPAAVPEPASALMIMAGGLVIAGYRRFFGRA